jgi:hypothetical protein
MAQWKSGAAVLWIGVRRELERQSTPGRR